MISISSIAGKIFYLYLGSLFLIKPSFAVVRTIFTTESKMQTIHLSMGRSTVLRFRGETPVKAVTGNQNYFNIEFVKGTSDVTLQPLGKVDSNLFIYTDVHSYGFLLKVDNGKNYDDRVDIRWNQKGRLKLGSKMSHRPKVKKISKVRLSFKKQVMVDAKSLIYLETSESHLLDLEITNLSSSQIKTSDLVIYPTRGNQKISHKKVVFEKDFIQPKEKIKARLVLLKAGKQGFTLNLLYGKRKAKKIISRWYL